MTITDPAALRLAAIVQSSDDAIISTTVDGTIETWNTAAERMFGRPASQAIGKSIELIIPDERRSDDRELMKRLRRGEIVTHFQTMAVAADGRQVPVSLALSPVLTSEGDMIGVARILRDLSTQRALEHEAFRLAAIVASSDDAIVSKDLNGIVQTWNSAAERMFGWTAKEIVGRSITTIIPRDRLHEEDMVLSAIRAGKSIEHFETVRQRKDGSQLTISVTISPIWTADGQLIGASKIARDITAQKRLEREAFRLAAIVDSSDDAIVSKDLNGIVQTWNRAAERMFGFTAAEIIGQSITLIIPKDRWAEEDTVLSRIRAGQSIEHFETIRQRKDGTLIEISLTVSPIRTPDGRVIGASKIARDISVQRRLAREAEEANRVKDEFLATLSHELRTPLNAVLGYTRMLRTRQLGNGRQEHAIDVIERNANVISQLVSDVLDVSRIVTGKIALHYASCDLKSVLSAAVDSIRPSAEAKGVAVHLDTPGRPVMIDCDSDRLQQVFWNLLSNAVKFTRRRGRVNVQLANPDGAALVTVADTGVGIRRESLPFVFQRFWQGESVNSRETGGLGLGLALARHFVELHGGTIAAESEGEGKGATFTIALPLARPTRPPS
jgi:PAS domain S-box-containing protein